MRRAIVRAIIRMLTPLSLAAAAIISLVLKSAIWWVSKRVSLLKYSQDRSIVRIVVILGYGSNTYHFLTSHGLLPMPEVREWGEG
jgi:hypothetical protein